MVINKKIKRICIIISAFLLALTACSNKSEEPSSYSAPYIDNKNGTADEKTSSYEDERETNMSALNVTAPVLNYAGNEVTFDLKSLTTEDKNITISIKTYENNVLKKNEEYNMTLKAGTKTTTVTYPAQKGSIISISDDAGNSCVEPFEVSDLKWISTWASAQQSLATDRSEYPPAIGLKGNTLRQIVRLSNGGTQIKLKFSNEYGKTPLTINSAHIAKPTNIGDSLIDASTDTMVTFNGGCENVTIPAGETIASDPIELNVTDLARIAVSTYFGSVPEFVTSHTGARTTTYLTEGNHVSDISLPVSEQMEHWYFLTGIDVISTNESKAVVCFGDSLTDGRGVTTNYDNRWTDILAERLQKNADTTNISVLNQGIGGNSVFGGLGPAGFKRFGRDVLEQDSVGYVILLIGINDIGYANSDTLVDKIIGQYKSFADHAHAKEIKVYGGTILPFGNNKEYYTEEYGAIREQIRQDINSWIRSSDGYFDAVIDFDAALKSPDDSKVLASVYDCGDGLHLTPEGYRVMGELADLNLFKD